MKEINQDTTIAQAIEMDEKVIEVLQGIGMHCMGCAMASGETLGQAAKAHGQNPDELIKKIRDAINNN